MAAPGNAATTDVAQTAHNAHNADDVATAHNPATADDVVTFAAAAIPAVITPDADAAVDANNVNRNVITKSTRTKIDNVSATHATASNINATTAAGDNTETTTGETKINLINITESLSVDGAVDALVSATTHAKKA